MPDYLMQRGHTWYAVMEIPKDLRPIIGQRRFMKTLGTQSRREALQRLHGVIQVWMDQIAQARGQTSAAAIARQWIADMERARAAEQDWYPSEDGEPSPTDSQYVAILDQAEELHSQGMTLADVRKAVDAAHRGATLIRPAWETWVAGASVGHRTRESYKQGIELLLQRHLTVEEVTRAAAGKFVDEVLKPGRKPETINRLVSSLSRFWDDLWRRGRVAENPWKLQRVPLKSRGPGGHEQERRRPFSEDEALALLRHIRDSIGTTTGAGRVLEADLQVCEIMAVTGMRLGEVCNLEAREVSEEKDGVLWLSLRKGKTPAARRRVPLLEPRIIQLLADRKGKTSRPTDPIFPELVPLGERGRAHYATKRLGRLVRMVITDENVVAAHSWRHRAETLQERADIAPGTSDWFMGHTRPGEGRGRYSAGPDETQLIAAARATTLPKGW